MVELLLEARADVNFRGADKRSAFDWAMARNHLHVAELLQSAGSSTAEAASTKLRLKAVSSEVGRWAENAVQHRKRSESVSKSKRIGFYIKDKDAYSSAVPPRPLLSALDEVVLTPSP